MKVFFLTVLCALILGGCSSNNSSVSSSNTRQDQSDRGIGYITHDNRVVIYKKPFLSAVEDQYNINLFFGPKYKFFPSINNARNNVATKTFDFGDNDEISIPLDTSIPDSCFVIGINSLYEFDGISMIPVRSDETSRGHYEFSNPFLLAKNNRNATKSDIETYKNDRQETRNNVHRLKQYFKNNEYFQNTKSLPADAGRFVEMLRQILKYRVIADVARCC